MSKTGWRRWVRDHRPPVTAETAAAVVEGLETFVEAFDAAADAAAGAGLILFYRAQPGELSLDRLADAVGWQRFAVTRTPALGPLTLHPAIGAMERHRFGFPQPIADALELKPRHIVLALVPGLAFDRRGTRLGRGAGYFDELLARLPRHCPRIGVTMRSQVLDVLPVEPHDVPMTHLATEDGVTAVAANTAGGNG
ncbi:5-formyltetrahydrofolate cyclo-ligase [Candidatus Poriferisodalis sp.]|uniref:5-formyltetrahydrofolate cyclo-ligase n=1 Tax=Candidatus Poriferisodalis sp. TaxID=3101277 RepID=UPI003B017580